MRKHPLIALIAFAFLAVAVFVGAAQSGGINSIPARATSHLTTGEGAGQFVPRADGQRWLAAERRAQATALATAQLDAQITAARSTFFWQHNVGDVVAIHDAVRPARALLPSQWLELQIRDLRAAAAQAHANAVAQQAQEAQAQAQAALQAQQALEAQQQQAALQAQQALEAQQQQAAKAAQKAQSAHKQQVAPAPTTTQPPTTTTQPAPQTTSSGGGELGGVWLQLRLCESGDNYGENTGNGYYGAYQFALSTWWGLGYTGLPSNAPPSVQDQAAEKLQALSGWGQWPGCSAELGL